MLVWHVRNKFLRTSRSFKKHLILPLAYCSRRDREFRENGETTGVAISGHGQLLPQIYTSLCGKITPLNTLLTAANEGQTSLLPKSNFDLSLTESANSAFVAC